MFKATKPFKDTITGYDKEPSLRIGKKVPENAVNLAYYYNSTATDSEKVLAADPPRQTIDHRIETQWLTRLDQASGPNGEEPSIDIFPQAVYYSDEEGYYGRLKRQDDTVRWYPEKHVNQKEVSSDNIQIVQTKGNEDKIIEYADADGYHGNLYLDTATYETYTTKDVSTTNQIDYTINNFELNYYEIFNKYINSNDLDNGPWTIEPNGTSNSGYCWPAAIELTASGLRLFDTNYPSNQYNNKIKKFINSMPNDFNGTNQYFVNNPDIMSTSKPIGYIYFDKLEYEPVKYDTELTNGSISKERIVKIESDKFNWKVKDITVTNYKNVMPKLSDIKINGNDLVTVYLADPATSDYAEIQDFISVLQAKLPSSSAITLLNEAINESKDIEIHVSKITFCVDDKKIDMLVNGSNIPGNEQNEIDAVKDPSSCYFEITYSYRIVDKGTEGTILYNITVNYHTITLDDGSCSVKRTLTTKKEEATSYKAYCHYSGLVNKNWVDYDGIAFYMGSVTKGNAVGNQNPDDDNEILMFPDKDGYLRKIVERINESTDDNGRTTYSIEYKNYYRVEADTVYITDVFKDGEACFYKHKLKQPIYDYRGPDKNGFYQGDAVQLYTSTLKDLPSTYKHNIKLKVAEYTDVTTYDQFNNTTITKIPKCYFAELYTSFISSSTDTFKCVYNGFNDIDNDNTVLNNGIEEDIYNAPFMIEGVDYELKLIEKKARLNQIQILNYEPLKDERLRVTFTWQVVAMNPEDQREFVSIIRQSSILNKEYCLPCEYVNFEERGMIISPKLNGDSIPASPRDICLEDQSSFQKADDDYEPIINDKDDKFIYSVRIVDISYVGTVNIKCNPDGSGVITAETTIDTGFYNESRASYTKKLDLENPYWTDGEYIYQGYKVKCIDSRTLKVKAPREKKLLESWYPMIQFGHYSRIMDQYGAHTKVCYSMPEYDTQHYSTIYGQPYVDVKEEQVEILNPHMVKTKCYPLYIIDPNLDENTFIHKNKTYRIFKNVKSWSDAEEICQKIGGHIAMPKTESECTYLANLAQENGMTGIWLGASKSQGNNFWRWTDNEYLSYDKFLNNNLDNSKDYSLFMYTDPQNTFEYELLDQAENIDVGHIDGFICEFFGTISLYKKVDNELFAIDIEDISFSDGVILTKQAISENDCIICNYTYLEENYIYRGYWRDDSDFVRIDLNPNIYHTYNNPNFLPSEVSPSKNLFNKVIYFFMKPSATFTVNERNGSFYDPNKVEQVPVQKTHTVIKYRDVDITVDEFQLEQDNLHLSDLNAIQEPFSSEKQILSFMCKEDAFDQKFEVTMNTGHLYGFAIKESEDGINFTTLNTSGYDWATHKDDVPLTIYIEHINFKQGFIYTIVTKECSGGGTEPEKFLYSFTSTNDFSIGIGHIQTVTKTIQEPYEEIEEYTDYEEHYVDEDDELKSENEKCLYHKIDDSEPDNDADIMLGSVYIRQDTSLHSTIVTDGRTRGGGILTGISESLRHELEPESDFYLDIGYYDGKPYQENGVIIVRLDNKILKEYGGRFTVSDVETKVKRWLGAGIYPIIEYVDSYKKEDLPQYNLTVENSYTNVIDITPVIYGEDGKSEEYQEPIDITAELVYVDDIMPIGISGDIIELNNIGSIKTINISGEIIETDVAPIDTNTTLV